MDARAQYSHPNGRGAGGRRTTTCTIVDMRREPRVLALVGPSESGKTTLIAQLIQRLIARNETVAAIKHTHHELNLDLAGDTGKFLTAGALPVILAGDGEAVVFTPDPRRVPYAEPPELLRQCPVDVVLVEGFKSFGGWPRLEVNRTVRVQDALELLDRIA